MTHCGFWLRVNGKWFSLPGVQAGVPVVRDRGMRDFTSLGGVRHVSTALRAARSWSLDFRHASPEAVRALMVAANASAGDVMLLDVSASRANMLDPLACVGESGAPLIDVAGLPLPSIVTPSWTQIEEVGLTANASVGEDLTGPYPDLYTSGTPQAWDSLAKVQMPVTGRNRELVSAELVLTERGYTEVTSLTARACNSNWTESTASWESPGWGMIVGTGTRTEVDGEGVWTIPIGGAAAFSGTAMSVRLSVPTGVVEFWTRQEAPLSDYRAPRMRLTYTVTPDPPPPFDHLVRAGVPHLLMGWTTAAPSAVLGSVTVDGASVPLVAPTGSGSRPFSVVFTPAADGLVRISLAVGPHLLSGLRLVDTVVDVNSWLPGQKAPCRVHVQDPSQTLNLLAAGEHGRSDYSVTLLEVG